MSPLLILSVFRLLIEAEAKRIELETQHLAELKLAEQLREEAERAHVFNNNNNSSVLEQ